MQCRNCGATVEVNSRFCGKCGSAIGASVPLGGEGAPATSHQMQEERAGPAASPAIASPAAFLRARGKISAATFGLVILSFLMPFVSVSCQGHKFVTLTGVQMVTGTTLRQPQMFGPPKTQKIDPEPLAILAFLCGVVGLIVSIAVGQRRPVVPAIFGAAGAILLFSLKSRLDGEVAQQSQGLFRLDYEVGFWLAALLFMAVASLSIVVYFGTKTRGPQ